MFTHPNNFFGTQRKGTDWDHSQRHSWDDDDVAIRLLKWSAQRGGERYSLDDKIVDRTLEVIGQRLVDGFYCTLLNDDFVR